MNRLRLFAMMILAALLLAACAPGSPTGAADPTGVEWKLVEINGKPALAGSNVTLTFEDGKGGGKGGCNSYGGSYRIQGGSLSFSDLFQTEMACMDPAGVMDQETEYLQTLGQAAGYQISGERLELKNAAGETVLVFQK